MLSSLYAVPQSMTDWLRWSFAHRDAHDRIRQAIQAQGGPNLPQYDLDPMPLNDMQNWLRRNQQSHIEFNGALRQQGSDLTVLNIQNEAEVAEWIQAEYLELFDAFEALGIANVS